jgi:hypothetical protein
MHQLDPCDFLRAFSNSLSRPSSLSSLLPLSSFEKFWVGGGPSRHSHEFPALAVSLESRMDVIQSMDALELKDEDLLNFAVNWGGLLEPIEMPAGLKSLFLSQTLPHSRPTCPLRLSLPPYLPTSLPPYLPTSLPPYLPTYLPCLP